jgi:CheY-like chemotaxis protein
MIGGGVQTIPDGQEAESQRTAAAPREQGEWPRVTLSSIGDAVITTDATGGVTLLNPVAQSLSGRLKDVRLVAMTGFGQEADLQLAREAGFDEHLIKPVDFVKVGEILKTLLTSPRPGKSTPQTRATCPITATPAGPRSGPWKSGPGSPPGDFGESPGQYHPRRRRRPMAGIGKYKLTDALRKPHGGTAADRVDRPAQAREADPEQAREAGESREAHQADASIRDRMVRIGRGNQQAGRQGQ